MAFVWNMVTAVSLSTVTALVHKGTVGGTVKQVCCSGTETCMYIRMYVRILLWCVIASLTSLHADLAQYVRPCGNSTCYNGGSHVCNEYTGTCLCRHPYTGQYCENVVG